MSAQRPQIVPGTQFPTRPTCPVLFLYTLARTAATTLPRRILQSQNHEVELFLMSCSVKLIFRTHYSFFQNVYSHLQHNGPDLSQNLRLVFHHSDHRFHRIQQRHGCDRIFVLYAAVVRFQHLTKRCCLRPNRLRLHLTTTLFQHALRLLTKF